MMFSWEQKSFRLASGFMTIGLLLVACMESSGAQSHSCSSLGQTLIAESSTIKTLTSPNYPSDYDSNTDCLWTIETSQRNGYIVEVTFDDFRLESDNVRSCGNHDYLVVYDGLPQSGSTIGTFCGFMDTPAKVYSTGRHLSLRFSTNMGFSYKGFKLSYFAVQAVSDKRKCFLGNIDNSNLELESTSGTFQSPRYPLKYPKFINCVWVITVPEGKLLKLSFEKFDVEWSASCDEDYVKVFDGQFSTSTVKKTLCGSSIPDDVYSTGRHMRVQFSSDSDNFSNYGFKAQFEEVNPNVKIIGYVIGATVVFLLCFVIACVILRCRNAKRTADSSTALTSIQQPYPPPPQSQFQSNSASSYMPVGTYPPSAVDYPSQPPPPYPYPAESPPPYPGEESAPQYPPPGNMYPWQQQNEGNNQSHVSA